MLWKKLSNQSCAVICAMNKLPVISVSIEYAWEIMMKFEKKNQKICWLLQTAVQFIILARFSSWYSRFLDLSGHQLCLTSDENLSRVTFSSGQWKPFQSHYVGKLSWPPLQFVTEAKKFRSHKQGQKASKSVHSCLSRCRCFVGGGRAALEVGFSASLLSREYWLWTAEHSTPPVCEAVPFFLLHCFVVPQP